MWMTCSGDSGDLFTRSSGGQYEAKYGTTSRIVGNLQMAVVELDDGAADVTPHADDLGSGGVEGHEQMLAFAVCNAGATLGHRDLDGALTHGARAHHHRTPPHRQAAHRFECIAHQIDNHLLAH